MHPQFRIEMLHERSRELANQINRSRLLAAEPTRDEIAEETVTFRVSRVSDDLSLARLAALEARAVPRGRQLLAEVDGEVIAALPLVGGAFLGDPFRATAHLLPLMRPRAAQLHAPAHPRMEAAKTLAARVVHPAR
jgi:hypothetical protein